MATICDFLLWFRLLVGFLGEQAQFAWWPTSFFEPSSQPFLSPVFAKTAPLAQYHGVVEAARRVHDEHLNVGSYHLFRLPEEIEQDLHNLAIKGWAHRSSSRKLRDREAALVALRDMADGQEQLSEGPIFIGRISELETPTIERNMAGAYFSAFTGERRTYPYLLGSGGQE